VEREIAERERQKSLWAERVKEEERRRNREELERATWAEIQKLA